MNIKNERKIIDGTIVLVAAICSYLTGYLQKLELGAVTVTLITPTVFLVGLTFLHLVIRKGRKFDRREHQLSYEGLKTLIFAGLTYSSYRTGLSTIQNGFIPQDLTMTGVSTIFILTSLFLMAYRPNN